MQQCVTTDLGVQVGQPCALPTCTQGQLRCLYTKLHSAYSVSGHGLPEARTTLKRRRSLTRVGMSCAKAGYPGVRGLQLACRAGFCSFVRALAGPASRRRRSSARLHLQPAVPACASTRCCTLGRQRTCSACLPLLREPQVHTWLARRRGHTARVHHTAPPRQIRVERDMARRGLLRGTTT